MSSSSVCGCSGGSPGGGGGCVGGARDIPDESASWRDLERSCACDGGGHLGKSCGGGAGGLGIELIEEGLNSKVSFQGMSLSLESL